MGYSIDVNNDNFDVEVVEKSYEKPVLVDFFAVWCGPCQLLKPILEKLANEYDFVLAKVDIDENQDLAHQFEVQGVPDVRVVSQGEIYTGFVGAVSEYEIINLLAQFNIKSNLELGIESVRQAITDKNPRLAKEILDELFNKYPERAEVVLESARFLVRLNRLDEAEKILKMIGEDEREIYRQAQSIKTLIQLQRIAINATESELDNLLANAARHTWEEDYEVALQGFLEIVQTNRKSTQGDEARKAMIAIFNLLGMKHPLTLKYQQELTLALY